MWESMTSEIDTVAKRAKLRPRKNPYWVSVGGGRGGVTLGYRKGAKPPGVWVAKIVLNQQRLEEKLGAADDQGSGLGALSYKAAVVAAIGWSAQQNAAIVASVSSASSVRPTVRSAVETYSKQRLRRSQQSGSNAQGRLAKHVLSDAQFSEIPLAKLRATAIQNWRDRLSTGGQSDAQTADKKPAPATVNRLMNDLRAALNAACEAHRRELPAFLPSEISIGTRALPVTHIARQQLLPDELVKTAVDVAFKVDEDGHFGRLVMLAAATGARYSQLAALQVGHVQAHQGRILMPRSKKGRSPTTKSPVAVPLSADVLEKLLPTLTGRNSDEPLLVRWAYRNVGPFKWEKDHLRPLGAAYEIEKQWAEVVRMAALPSNTIMYALRHSSIVRGLRIGLPVRLVASLHDTSIEMIEKHYSAFIVDMTEDLARRAVISF